MSTIEKKIRPEMFEKLQKGEMNFDVRLADFSCDQADVIKYREWDPKINNYTGREVVHCLSTKDHDYWTDEEVAKHGFNIIRLKRD